MQSLDAISKLLDRYKPLKIPCRRVFARAGVAIILLNNSMLPGISALIIRRAKRLGDPWSGHMAFPGGRYEKNDPNLFCTVTRELSEEIGLDNSANAKCIGRLSDIVTMNHNRSALMIVTPLVFRIEREPQWQLGDEVDEVLWVSLDYFANPKNREHMNWRLAGINFRPACYMYNNDRIWGLTFMMIDELINALQGDSGCFCKWIGRYLYGTSPTLMVRK